MLMVSSARVNDIIEAVDGQEMNGILFRLVKKEGLMAYIDCGAADEDEAAAVLKRRAKDIPRLKNMFINIRIVDNDGNIR